MPENVDQYEFPIDETIAVDEGDKKKEEIKEDVSPTMQQALNEGWVPKEDFSGDEDSWVEAKEFVFRGELMNRIKKQSGVINSLSDETSNLKDALKALGEHNKKLADIEYKKAITTLKREKLEALEERDNAAVIEIDEQIEDLKEAQKETTTTSTETTSNESKEDDVPQVVVGWLNDPKNSWFNTDIILRGAADALGGDYLQRNPDDLDGMLKYIDKEIRKEFPVKFNIKAPNTNTVAGSDGRSKGKMLDKRNSKKVTPRDLSEEQYSVGKTFVSQGVYKNMQEWVDELQQTDQL